MNVGMLWFDNDTQADLNVKIERAASYYQTKYGRKPDLCYVHPSMAPQNGDTAAQLPVNNGKPSQGEAVLKSGGVEVRTTRSVLPHHLWIGLNGTNGNGSAGR